MIAAQTHRWEQPLVAPYRVLVWLLSAGLVAGVVWAAFAKVSVYAVVRGTLESQSQPVQVNAPGAGRVVSGSLTVWQRVHKGQVLFTLSALGRDPQDAALQLTVQQSAAAQARQDIAAAEIELGLRSRAARNAQSVYDLGGLPRVELETANGAVQSVQATLARAEAQLASAQAQLSLLSRSQSIVVRSPIDGQIMALTDLHLGQVLAAGQNAVQILPQSVPLVFRGEAAESDRPKLRQAAHVQVAWNGYPRQKYGVTEGLLTEVAPTSQAAASGEVSYRVEVSLPHPATGGLSIGHRPLLPGMAGEAHVLSDQKTMLGLFWDWLRGADPWS
jgi:multidrug efflux pump subunit AcrA (membrane-fusion protein)